MSGTSSLYTLKRIEFLAVVGSKDLFSRVEEVAKFFSFKAEVVSNFADMDPDSRQKSSPIMSLISLAEGGTLEQNVERVAELRKVFPHTEIVAILIGGESVDEHAALKAAGMNRVILRQEVLDGSKLFYLSAMLMCTAFFPVPVLDIFPGTQVSFNGYHKMPLNQKYLSVIFNGFVFSDKKYRRLEPVKQVYIRRRELKNYRGYIETYHDRSGNALKKRCRTVIMNLIAMYGELTLSLTLDAEAAHTDKLKTQLEEFLQIAQELGDYLKECPDVWNVISQSLEFEFCGYERGAAILCYGIYLNQSCQVGSLHDVVLGTLLADIGLVDMPSEAFKAYLAKGPGALNPADLAAYQNHPMNSLNRLTSRQLETTAELRSIIVCTHERWDEKGFPNQVPKDKLPETAQLIYFCELLERSVRAQQEHETLSLEYLRRKLWEDEKAAKKHFGPEFLDKIEKVLLPPVAQKKAS